MVVSVVTNKNAPLRCPDRFFIGGEWVVPSTVSMFDVIQPATEEVFVRVAEAKDDDVRRAISAARMAFDEGPWPRLSHAERAVHLRAIAAELRARSDDLSEIWSNETGLVHAVSRPVTMHVSAYFDYYAGLADDFPWIERHQPEAGNVGLLVREPVGVVGAIIPWNTPLPLIALKVAPALIAGCTVVLKASPQAPGEAYVLAEICEEIGLPPGVFNVITADREASELLVRDPRVDKISFTGSTAAGRRIGSIMGERVGRCSLELGGKSAAVVLDDCDVAEVAATLTPSAVALAGQVCSSLTRIVVTRRHHDELVEALSDSFSRVTVGDPFDPTIEMGPLAMRRQRDRVEAYITLGVEQGATLATGGRRPRDLACGFFIEPTVFANVDNSSTIAQEEIFGPVLSVIPASDEDDAVRIANDSIYGLNASVFTNDDDRAYTVARQLKSGTVGQNAFRSDNSIAFGGFKQSGIGREGGREGLREYLEPKTIILDSEPTVIEQPESGSVGRS